MREIDDRYPEFAPMHEPVGKNKSRKGLYWSIPGLALILSAALMGAPIAVPAPEPEPEPEPIVVVEPKPEPAPVVVPVSPPSTPSTPAADPSPAAVSPAAPPTPATPQYTVTFVNWDGTPVASGIYDEGTSASNIWVPSDPTRSNDSSYRYTFAG